MCDVRPIDVIRWQNRAHRAPGRRREGLGADVPATVNNQLNAIFNHAERYYGLSDNPVRRVDKIGSKKGGEMQFWTKDEYLRFSEAVMDKPLAFHAFELLYWTGIRCGELRRSRRPTSCWRARGCASTSRTRASTAWTP